ncbi:hypothetical protein KKE06_00170, partial [Candidatus Micrarchaeota archaeon]|nr:hypothetical protein [Candidatus Micrarchaeota archaeon]MBU1930100.1 hypothetical protein [Candidatus Micrarchaeota archaeon]
MVVGLDEKELVAKKLRELAKALRQTNNQLHELSFLRVSLDGVSQQLRLLMEKTENQLELKESLSRELQSQQIFELFGELQSQLASLKKTVLDLEGPLLQETVFLEGHRTYRYYTFLNQEKSFSFLNQLAELYAVQQFFFKPEFMGLIDFRPLEKELDLQKKDKSGFIVSTAQLERVFEFLRANNFSKNFR